MSDFRVIAGVSYTLRTLLRDRMEEKIPVTLAPPDVTPDGVSGKRLNLYLYQVTENGYLKNQSLPGNGHPPLSLDLHYLLTPYGSSEKSADSDIESQQILGDSMRVLHDIPIISDSVVITNPSSGTVGDPILNTSLLGEFEKVKITLQPLTIEDYSKLWTALPQANFRRSVAYQVSVVQIESKRSRSFPRLVGEPPRAGPRVHAVPYNRPRISGILVRRSGDPSGMERSYPYACIGDTLIIKGSNLSGHAARVLLGTFDATSQLRVQGEGRMELTIPDVADLQPGALSVKIVRDVMMGEPPHPHSGLQSNLAVFILTPLISSLHIDTGSGPRTLKIEGKRIFLDSMSGETLVGDMQIPKGSYIDPTSDEIIFPVPDTLPAWPVQCLISGDLGSSPNFQNLSATPQVQIKIGDDGPHTATLEAKPANLAEAADLLQIAIRTSNGASPGFKGTRVTTVGDNRLLIVPGGLGDTVVCTGPDAVKLKLMEGNGSTTAKGYLSGELTPFPTLTNADPAVQMTINGEIGVAVLPARPETLVEASQLLEASIKALGNGPFTDVEVTTLGQQLLILASDAGVVRFELVAGRDETTVSELQLDTQSVVRVRVNDAENIEEKILRLPGP